MNFIEFNILGFLNGYAPELLLAVGVLLNLLCAIFPKSVRPRVSNILTIVLLAASFLMSFSEPPFFRGLLYLCAFVCSVFSVKFTKKLTHKIYYFNALLLSLVLGAAFLVGSKNFLTLFVSLEIVSISAYLLTAIFMNKKALEASVKYFIQGVVASCLLLLAISYLYLIFGTLGFEQISRLSQRLTIGLLPVSNVILFSGIAFKLAVLPFCSWVSDTFEGADYSVGLLLATVSKVAAVAVAIKLAWLLVPSSSPLQLVLIVLALLTLVFSNLLAMRQKNIKRFLAYSTISHAGYILLGTAILSKLSINSAVFYLVAYLIATFGLFAGFGMFSQNAKGKEDLEDLQGMAYTNPLYATLMAICLFSLAGMPPMLGFAAKFFLFVQVMSEGIWATLPMLVVIFASVVALFYYTKIVSFFFKRTRGMQMLKKTTTLKSILAVAVFLLIFLIFFTGPIIKLCNVM